ncbi:dephospho-CoA kinase [Mycolicibacterium sp. 3033]|nr:dephospho-CoA kinase [Mycolicibacterium aurantiacum]
MLRIGLTGGIGAGKSTVSATFDELGAVVVDGDVIAREVVEPGTPGLKSLVEAFGEDILAADGSLNRPALAAIAFSDDEKRKTLNGIVHPLVGQRRSELIAAAADDAVIVEDIPLLVESQMAPLFPLVIIVHADEELRVQRLIEHRGFTEEDARARIAAQATEADRRAVADVWLDNSGTADELVGAARALWHTRIHPFADNLRHGRPAPAKPGLVPSDPEWTAQARRILARLRTVCGHHASRVDHVGSTAVSGLDAEDVIDVQVTVASLDVADDLAGALLGAGYVRTAITEDTAEVTAKTGVDGQWGKRLYCSADPGRPTNVHVRVDGWPNQQFALLYVDWLTAEPAARAEFLGLTRRAAGTPGQPWLTDAYRRAWAWAEASGWHPS